MEERELEGILMSVWLKPGKVERTGRGHVTKGLACGVKGLSQGSLESAQSGAQRKAFLPRMLS